jgi:hypothetical protein
MMISSMSCRLLRSQWKTSQIKCYRTNENDKRNGNECNMVDICNWGFSDVLSWFGFAVQIMIGLFDKQCWNLI